MFCLPVELRSTLSSAVDYGEMKHWFEIESLSGYSVFITVFLF